MCMFSKPKAPPKVAIPAAPVAPAAPQAAPQAQDASVTKARDDDRLRRLRASSENNTMVTGGQGLTSQPSTAAKTLYGQ